MHHHGFALVRQFLSILSRPSSLAAPVPDPSREHLPGPVHKIPADLRKALDSEAPTKAAWKHLTPLAQNELICWVISAKQATTRSRRIQRAVEELKAGKRRPCCWPGCPHRRPSAKKWFERRVR